MSKSKSVVSVVKGLVGRNAKAIAAFVTAVIVNVASRYVNVPEDVVVAVNGLIVAVVVWITANR